MDIYGKGICTKIISMRTNNASAGHHQKETHRLELFSDGVFAVAITLLVLELIQKLHPENGTELIGTVSLIVFAHTHTGSTW